MDPKGGAGARGHHVGGPGANVNHLQCGNISPEGPRRRCGPVGGRTVPSTTRCTAPLYRGAVPEAGCRFSFGGHDKTFIDKTNLRSRTLLQAGRQPLAKEIIWAEQLLVASQIRSGLGSCFAHVSLKLRFFHLLCGSYNSFPLSSPATPGAQRTLPLPCSFYNLPVWGAILLLSHAFAR